MLPFGVRASRFSDTAGRLIHDPVAMGYISSYDRAAAFARNRPPLTPTR